MDVLEIGKTQVNSWIRDALSADDLLSGRASPPFNISVGEIRSTSDYKYIDTAKVEPLTIDLVNDYQDLTDFLDSQSVHMKLAAAIREVLLRDASVRFGGQKEDLMHALKEFGGAPLAVLLSKNSIQHFVPLRIPEFVPVYKTLAVASDEVLIVHPGNDFDFIFEPIGDYVQRGSQIDVLVGVGIAKLPQRSPIRLDRFNIPPR